MDSIATKTCIPAYKVHTLVVTFYPKTLVYIAPLFKISQTSSGQI